MINFDSLTLKALLGEIAPIIENAKVASTSYDIGTLAGSVRGGSVYNCYAKNVEVSTTGGSRPGTGGLVGGISEGYGGSIEKCYTINAKVSNVFRTTAPTNFSNPSNLTSPS